MTEVEAGAGGPAARATVGLGEAFERIGTYLEARLPHMHAAGASLAVTDGEGILGAVVRGFADAASGAPVRPETRFEIGSISKSFTAALALQEVAAGRLDLHAPVDAIVPWVELRQPYGPITVHHLLTHTSGLPIGTEASADDRFAVWNLRRLEPGFPPGQRLHYSNDGYKLVGVVVEHVAGRPLRELLADRILRPLGMDATSPSITNDDRRDLATGYRTVYDDRPSQRRHPLVEAPWIISTSGDGSIISNAIDMCRYLRMLLARGAGPDARVLSEEGFALLTGGHVEDQDDPGWHYGYGLWVRELEGTVRWRHSGGMVGYTALLSVDADAGLGAIMLCNGWGDRDETVRFALDSVRAALTGESLPDVGPPPDPTRTPNAREYAGRYRDERGEIELVDDGARLALRQARSGVDVVLEPERDARDTFLVPDDAWDRFSLRFGRDADGRVVEALHGERWFRGERQTGEAEPSPDESWSSFAGHYRSYDPWMPSFRVLLRKGRLVLIAPGEDDLELVPLADGSFRVGPEEWRPDRIRFDPIVDGQAVRALYDEAAWYRSFTP